MNMKSIVAVAIALTVGIVTFSGVLIPAIESGVDTNGTFINNGYYEMTYDERDEVTVLWEYAHPYQLTVNDEVVPIDPSNFSSSQRKSILIGDAFVMRTNASYQSGTWYPLIQFNGSTGNSIWAGAVPGSEADMSVVCSNGTATVTVTGSSPVTFSYTYLYTVSNDGEYVMKYNDAPAYMLKDSDFIAMGTSVVDGVEIGVKITGDIENGATITTWKATDTWSFSDIVVNKTAVDGYIDLYKLTTITANAEDDNSHSGSITYSYYLVPTEVTAEKSIHADASTTLLFQTIPVFIVLGMIVAVVGVLYMKTRR